MSPENSLDKSLPRFHGFGVSVRNHLRHLGGWILAGILVLSLQVGVVFLLLHSLRWEDQDHTGLAALRRITAGTWIVHSFTWTNVDETAAGWFVSSSAVSVLALYTFARIVSGRWGALAVPAGAVLSFVAAPAHYFIERIKHTPGGHLAILGSFLLFGFGTLLAMTRHRWHPAGSAREEKKR